MIEVFVVDHQALIRTGLKALLSAEADICVGGEGASLAELEGLLATKVPQVLVLDLEVSANTLDALKHLRTVHPQMAVLILSAHPADRYAVRALRAGAAGYVAQESANEEIADAIRRVASGERYISDAVAKLLRATDHDQDNDQNIFQDSRQSDGQKKDQSGGQNNDPIDHATNQKTVSAGGSTQQPLLSRRELAVLTGIGQGKALTAIAREMSVSVKTVSTYRTRLMKKLNFSSNAQLIRYVLEQNPRG